MRRPTSTSTGITFFNICLRLPFLSVGLASTLFGILSLSLWLCFLIGRRGVLRRLSFHSFLQKNCLFFVQRQRNDLQKCECAGVNVGAIVHLPLQHLRYVFFYLVFSRLWHREQLSKSTSQSCKALVTITYSSRIGMRKSVITHI